MPVVTQSLQTVVPITVVVTPVAAAAPLFNQGCIVGTSAVIPTYAGSTPRIRLYNTLAQMLSDGFVTSQPEYLAAAVYFGQNPSPQYLQIGRQDLTAIQTLVPHTGNPGTGYVINDVVTILQSGATFGTATVTTVGSGGAVTGLTPLVRGTGYATATALGTSGGTGSGLEIDITAIGETPLQAVTACRVASQTWYVCIALAAGISDEEAIALYLQGISPPSVYFYTSSDLTGVAATALQASQYSRTLGITSTTQNGAYPNNAYAAAAVMGVAMGLNSGVANSYFTLKFKPLVGIAPEPLTASQVATIEGLNSNVCLNNGNQFTWIEQGTMANGQFFDEILGIDQLVADIQTSVVNVFIGSLSVPQSNAGTALLINAVNGACARAAARGFIGAGTWTGTTILNLTAGTALPDGYLVQSQPYTTQSAGDMAARKGTPLYVSLIEAGAVHQLSIEVFVQR